MLGDAIRAMLPTLRAEAESMMVDTIKITRPGATTTDPETGEVSTDGAVVYGPTIAPHLGKARWKPGTTASTSDEVGTAQPVSSPGQVQIPVAVTVDGYTPIPGDIIECLTCQLDPPQAGRKTAVQSRFGGTHVTMYRIPIEGV